MRKLASIQKILDIQPIEGADAIETATVNSWKVVVKKGEFQIGDMIIYLEVDSWVPNSIAPFLSKGQEPKEYKDIKGECLRTVRLRGQISQGLILPLGILDTQYLNWYEGMDISELLGIQKFEPPVPAQLAGVVKGPWPSNVPHTDEERIQNLTNEWPVLKQYVYEVSEKIEGSSCSMGMIDGEFVVMSRNLNLKETEGNTLWKLARTYNVEDTLRRYGYDNLIIQGEAVGEGIQGNHYGLKGQDFYVFAIYDIEKAEYVDPSKRNGMIESFGMKHVPVIMTAEFDDETIDDVLKMADGQSKINRDKLREGLVFKRIDGQEHWKVVSNRYLLKTNN